MAAVQLGQNATMQTGNPIAQIATSRYSVIRARARARARARLPMAAVQLGQNATMQTGNPIAQIATSLYSFIRARVSRFLPLKTSRVVSVPYPLPFFQPEPTRITMAEQGREHGFFRVVSTPSPVQIDRQAYG